MWENVPSDISTQWRFKSARYAHWLESAIRMMIFVCVEVLRPSQPNGVMSSAVSLPNHTFTGQA